MSIPVRYYSDHNHARNALKTYIHPSNVVGVAMIGEYIAFASFQQVIYFQCLPCLTDDLVFIFNSVHPLKVTFSLDELQRRWTHCQSVINIHDLTTKKASSSTINFYNEINSLNTMLSPLRIPHLETMVITLATKALHTYQVIIRPPPTRRAVFNMKELFTTITLLNTIFIQHQHFSLEEVLSILHRLQDSDQNMWAPILRFNERRQTDLLHTLVQKGFLVFSQGVFTLI